MPFDSREDWVRHLIHDHGYNHGWPSLQCALCMEHTGSGEAKVTIHLEKHLQDICLAALPIEPEESKTRSASPSVSFSSQQLGDEGYSLTPPPRPSTPALIEEDSTLTPPPLLPLVDPEKASIIETENLPQNSINHTSTSTKSMDLKVPQPSARYVTHYSVTKFPASAESTQSPYELDSSYPNTATDLHTFDQVKTNDSILHVRPIIGRTSVKLEGDDIMRCPHCDFVHTGKSQNLNAYLRKHMKTHDKQQVKCPNCDKVFTMQDNLKGYIDKDHGQRGMRFAEGVQENNDQGLIPPQRNDDSKPPASEDAPLIFYDEWSTRANGS